MNVFFIICITCIGLMIYSLLAFDRSVRQTSSTRRVTNMEERSGANKFSFFYDGFKFDMSRSVSVVTNIERSSRTLYEDFKVHDTSKSMVMVDNHTSMPFLITICEKTMGADVYTNITSHRPVWNRMDMIDLIGNIRAYKMDDIDLDSFVYLDDVYGDSEMMSRSRNVLDMITA